MFDILKWTDIGCACKKMRLRIFYLTDMKFQFIMWSQKNLLCFLFMRPIEIELCVNFLLAK